MRAALGEPLAYESEGFSDACVLLGERSRREEVPLVEASLPGGDLRLGAVRPGRSAATLRTSNATLIKLFAGRPVEPGDYHLVGATPEELVDLLTADGRSARPHRPGGKERPGRPGGKEE